MGYKLRKHELICIAQYVIKHHNDINISDEQLVSNFYEMLMHALDNNKTTISESSCDVDSEEYFEIKSDDESYSTNKQYLTNKNNSL